jgi:pyruvyltransferase
VVHAPPRQVLALRGPLSAKRLKQLGLASPAVFGDPGAFAAQLFPQSPRTVDLGVVPHYVDSEHAWVKRMAAAGGKVIDPLAPLERYMAELSACKRIVSSSLHGLIFAHSFGIPAAWIRLSDAVIGDGFKFRDYFASVGLAHNGQPKLTPRSSARDATDACWLPPRAIDAAALRELLVEARATLVAGPGRWWRRGRARRG